MDVADLGGVEAGGERAGKETQALALSRGVDEAGEDGFAIIGEDFDGVFVHNDFKVD